MGSCALADAVDCGVRLGFCELIYIWLLIQTLVV